MANIFVQYLAIYSDEICPISSAFYQSGLNIFPNTKWWTIKKLPKAFYFTKFRHTVITCFGLYLNCSTCAGRRSSPSFACVGIVLTVTTIGIFIKFADTPLVRASGRELSYVILVSHHFLFLPHSPTLMAFTGVTNAHGPSTQPTAVWQLQLEVTRPMTIYSF